MIRAGRGKIESRSTHPHPPSRSLFADNRTVQKSTLLFPGFLSVSQLCNIPYQKGNAKLNWDEKLGVGMGYKIATLAGEERNMVQCSFKDGEMQLTIDAEVSHPAVKQECEQDRLLYQR